MSKGGNPAEAIMGSAKNFLAGILFLFPGVITDVFGLLILFKSGNGLSFDSKVTNI